MKLREAKLGVWGGYQKFYGRYKKFKVEIISGGNGNWYVLMDSEKLTFNSLWEGSEFDSIEESKTYAIKWIDFVARGETK